MTRKTEVLEPTKTRKVRVQKHESWVEEEPVNETEEIEIPTEAPNPIEEFLRQLDTERQLVMHVFLIPNWQKDGRFSTRTIDRAYVTNFAFTAEEVEGYRNRIQAHYPPGGMFDLELREKGQIVRRWQEQIMTAPGYQPPQQQGSGYPVIVNPPTQPQQVSPAEIMREHMSLAKDLVSMAKDLQPPIIEANGNGAAGEKPLEDKIFETVITAALGRPETKIETVLEALSGRNSKEPGFIELAMPVVGELFKYVGPSLGSFLQNWANQQAINQAKAAREAGIIVQQPAAQPESDTAAAPNQLQADPAEIAWRRMIQRMIEDCERDTSSTPTAHGIFALVDDFPALKTYVDGLLDSPPEQVIELCASIAPEPIQPAILAMKENKTRLSWVIELQQDTKEIFKEYGEQEQDSSQGKEGEDVQV